MRRSVPLVLMVLLSCGPMFYQAPPLIGEYPERLATKRWTALFHETEPPHPEARERTEEARVMGNLVPWMKSDERLPAIDRLLEVNRSGNYSAARANWLHELRELAVDTAMMAAAEPYLEWRLEKDRPRGMEVEAKMLMEPDPMGADARAPDAAALKAKRLDKELAAIDEGIKDGAEAVRPNWKVQRGAHLFQRGRHQEAAAEFEAVIGEFPDHPRAEAAGIMLARCHLEESRQLRRRMKPGDQESRDAINWKLSACERVLGDFIGRYPEGRFTPDAHGWLGAVAFDRGRLGLAVKHQLERLERQPTREVKRTVLRECDFVFGKLFQRLADETGFHGLRMVEHLDAEAVARHPLVVRLFVQHALDPAGHFSPPLDSETGDTRGTIEFLRRRILRPQPFVREALVELGRELLKVPGGADDPTTLLLLAWSATESGEHEQAWGLLEATGEANDEILHARAIVLQRLGRHDEAVVAFATLEERFPESPLTVDAPFRRMVSLVKSGRSGEAVVGLAEQHPQHQARIAGLLGIRSLASGLREGAPARARQGLQPGSYLTQWLDTTGQFAPLAQIVAACDGLADDHPLSRSLDDLIRLRALAARDFRLALRHLSPASPQGEGRGIRLGNIPPGRNDFLRKALRQDEDVWEDRIRHLAKLYDGLSDEMRSAEKAALHLEIAGHWMKHRGFITMPLIDHRSYAASEWEKQDLLRRANALHLGFDREEINAELDRRDEATHALEHALAAAMSDDPAIAAPALELANHCLFRRAEFSLYQRSRAIEMNATALSRDLYRQLRERFPNSAEARRAVYHVFLPALGPWMPGDYHPANSHAKMLEALAPEDTDEEQAEEARLTIIGLPQWIAAPGAAIDLSTLRERIDAGRREIHELRTMTAPARQDAIIEAIDRMDDFAAAAALPGISVEDFRSYAHGRRDALPEVFESLVDFRQRLEPEGPGMEPRDDTMGGWRAFLALYPDSPKAEAASLRLTRRIARLFRTRMTVEAYHFPEAPITGGYKRVAVLRDDEADGTHFVLTSIAEHDARFPEGRYRDDIDLLRAGALIDSGKPAEALPLIQRILETATQRDLHGVAVLLFAEIAQDLASPGKREGPAEAFRTTPTAVETLKRLADGDTFLSRLQPLLPWLEETGAR